MTTKTPERRRSSVLDTSMLEQTPELGSLEAEMIQAGAAWRAAKQKARDVGTSATKDQAADIRNEGTATAARYADALLAWAHHVLTEAGALRRSCNVTRKRLEAVARAPHLSPAETREAREDLEVVEARRTAVERLEVLIRNRLSNTFGSKFSPTSKVPPGSWKRLRQYLVRATQVEIWDLVAPREIEHGHRAARADGVTFR